MNLEQYIPFVDCQRFFKKGWLISAAIGFICVYTPIRAYALRNIYCYKEELKHDTEAASDVTDEMEKAGKIKSNKIEH